MASRRLSCKFTEALEFAARAHDGQVKKGTRIPYVSHLLAVCALVLEHGGTEKEAIAALLHDTLEDQPQRVSRAAIRDRFGAEVLRIVEGCSDTPRGYTGGKKPPWKVRKQGYLRRLRRHGEGVVLVALADKLHNARAIRSDYDELGDELWGKFNAGRDDQMWYFRALVSAFRKTGAPRRMLKEFEQVVCELGVMTGN